MTATHMRREIEEIPEAVARLLDGADGLRCGRPRASRDVDPRCRRHRGARLVRPRRVLPRNMRSS